MKRNQFLDPFQVSLSQGASKKGTGAAFWCCEDHFDASNAESMEDGTSLAKKTEAIDLCIVGGGPAGVAAAIQSHRLGLRVLLVEKEGEIGGWAHSANYVENYPGFPQGITGEDLVARFQKQLQQWQI